MKDQKHRIWEEGEGLSWSTITEILGQDEDVFMRLKKMTLDLTDALFVRMEAMKKKKEEMEKLGSEIDFIKGNLGSCLNFAKRRMEHDYIRVIHDRQPKVVTVEIEDKKLSVKEELITLKD